MVYAAGNDKLGDLFGSFLEDLNHPSYYFLTVWEWIGQEQKIGEAGVRNTGFEGGMYFQKGKNTSFPVMSG